jgi:hypothetical protein
MKEKPTTKAVRKKRPVVEKPKRAYVKALEEGVIENLYEECKGRYARFEDRAGIICGYDDKSLIIAVLSGKGWDKPPTKSVVIKSYQNNARGYYFVSKASIIG